MPTMTFSLVNLAANSTSANQLSGQKYEFVPFDAVVNVYCVASIAGDRINVTAGTDVVVDDMPITKVGTTLIRADHLLDSFEVTEGTQLGLRIREVGGIATTDYLGEVELLPTGE